MCLGTLVVVAADQEPATLPDPPAWSTAARSSPLEAAEEALPEATALARRFNPAMALADGDVWPVDVSYAWSEGADVVAQVMGRSGEVLRSSVAVPHRAIERRPWGDLPTRDEAGRPIRYTVDAPGDDSLDRGQTRWRRRFAAGAARFPPTQYAHLFWYNRAQGLLGIQYWFYYPFNEWVNSHEGDWEHVNVILRGPTALAPGADTAFTPVGYQFFFHRWRHDTADAIRVRRDGGDHVMVFAGGKGRWLWWGGSQSGASYPLPAVYPSGVLFGPNEDTRRPVRYLAGEDFRVIVLPEPHRIDLRAHPELSWVRLPFFLGQQRVSRNPPPIQWLGLDGPPLQPAWRRAWNATTAKPLWPRRVAGNVDLRRLPFDWSVIAAPNGALSLGPLARVD